MSNLYALDGLCHNAEPGTYGHECGKPAKWVGTSSTGFQSGYCDDCKVRGWEGKSMGQWRRLGIVWRAEDWRSPLGDWLGWRVVRGAGNTIEIALGGEFATSVGPINGYRHRIAARTLAVDLNRKAQEQST